MPKQSSQKSSVCCPLKPLLEERPLISISQAGELTGLFKLLANETRLRLLHSLSREGEVCVTELSNGVGMKPQAVSNQLQMLASRGIVSSRRNGNQIYYRIVDPCVTNLLDRGLCLMEDAKDRKP